MEEIYKILLGVAIIALGFPMGLILARLTKEELKSGRFWFNLLVIVSGIGAVVSLVFWIDYMFFSFLFFMAVTSMSLRRYSVKRSFKRHKKKLISKK